MKQRVTYLLPSGAEFGASDIQVVGESLNFAKADQASEEWRLTRELDELPDELQIILESFHELHIRLASPWNDESVHPLFSKLPAGIHAFLTPSKADTEVPFSDLLDAVLKDPTAIDHSLHETCNRQPLFSEVSPGKSAYQFYRYSSLRNLRIAETFLQGLCEFGSSNTYWSPICYDASSDVRHATYIDIDFDARVKTVTVTFLWTANAVDREDVDAHRTGRQYQKYAFDDKLEVGVLRREEARLSEELSVGGYLIVVGEKDHPSSTLFSFLSRHRPPSDTSMTFVASFQEPTGLHPKLQIRLPRGYAVPPKETCTLHAYMTLPSALFIDSYQLTDHLFLDSQNLVALESLSGEQDLEAPEWVVKGWGSAALLQLAVPKSTDLSANANEDWIVTIPMHLRYLAGRSRTAEASSEATLQVPWPIVFWTCDAGGERELFNNPFDRTHVGYDALFGPRTIFYHVPPAPNVTKTVMELKVPILAGDSGWLAQIGTLAAVAFGFLWVCWQLLNAANPTSESRKQSRKQK